MISFDFDYYKPDSAEEAAGIYDSLTGQGRKAIYYAGGTEIISLARTNLIRFDAVIDIKNIPECREFGYQGDKLVIGAAVTLTKISDSDFFPLLGKCCRRAADHTARDKITLGGNICGSLPYKEALLPLLLCDCEAVIAGSGGMRTQPLTAVFDKELKLRNGEFLAQVSIDRSFAGLPFSNIKKTRQDKVDYPLVAVSLIGKNKSVRAAFSGLCQYPFRLPVIEEDLNNGTADLRERIDNVFRHLPGPVLDDILSSSGYREFVARNALEEAMTMLEAAMA